jgi:hypothetical protein
VLTRLLGLVCVGSVLAGLGASCAAPAEGPAAEAADVSAVRQAQIATRVFRKLIGRDPSPAEIGQLRNATLEGMVDTVLASPDFQRDGFFGFQRDRLLLHRDGDENWLKASLKDYCGLKLEMEDVAKADVSGAGYYEILRYRERWVGVTRATLGIAPACLGVKVGALKSAMGLPGGTGAVTGAVSECGAVLQTREPFRTELGALDDAANDATLASTEAGQRLAVTLLNERMFRPPPAVAPADGTIELALDGAGQPQLRTFDGPPDERCATVDALTQAPAGADPVVYLKVRVPPAIEGVHGSMYWLSRHPSTQKNRDLHRARLLFFSYMCTEISPAMAVATGGAPVEIDELKPYFDPQDEHVRTSGNCYDCHTQVQPLANYFGELTKGANYTGPAAGGGLVSTSHYQQGDGFRRPGGLWKGQKFHADGAGEFGMEGLANLLSSLEIGHDCVAQNAWSTLVGRGYPLTEPERALAVKAFKGDGTPRFQNVLRHFILENPRGKAFFEGGETALDAAKPAAAEDCHDVANVPPEAASAGDGLLAGACAGCHSGNSPRAFFERVTDNGVAKAVWKPERLVGPGLRYAHLAEAYDTAYCRVHSGSMPMGGWDESDGVAADVKRKNALCFLAGKRNEAARESEDPAVKALEKASCNRDAPPPPSADPHPVEP